MARYGLLIDASKCTGCTACTIACQMQNQLPPEINFNRLEMMERETLLEALARNNWIQQKAAREIGLTLRQMGYRVKKFKLDKIIREKKKPRSVLS